MDAETYSNFQLTFDLFVYEVIEGNKLEELIEEAEEVVEEITEEDRDHNFDFNRDSMDKGMFDIGALDYIDSIIPRVEDVGSLFIIEGMGSIHKSIPQWNMIKDFITQSMYFAVGERTRYCLKYRNSYDIGEQWFSLGIRNVVLPFSPKEFTKNGLKRFLKIVPDDDWRDYVSSNHVPEILNYEDCSWDEVTRVEELIEVTRYHLKEIFEMKQIIFLAKNENKLKYDLDQYGFFIKNTLLSKKTLMSLDDDKILTEVEKNLVEVECKQDHKIPYDLFEENGEYLIRSPKNSLELLDEGLKLHHCVGSYIKGILGGHVQIYFIRKDWDTPLYTLEVSDNIIYQLRGMMNSIPEQNILENILEWLEEDLGFTRASGFNQGHDGDLVMHDDRLRMISEVITDMEKRGLL